MALLVVLLLSGCIPEKTNNNEEINLSVNPEVLKSDSYMFILEERVDAPDYIKTYNATGNRTIDIGFNNEGFITELVFRCDEGFIQREFYCEERLEGEQ